MAGAPRGIKLALGENVKRSNFRVPGVVRFPATRMGVEVVLRDAFRRAQGYRADEILMLIRLADEFGFKVRTFQHVLEGYKVATEIARHGAGASTFADWWGYKIEAYDAMPYNAAVMYRA